LDGIYVISDTVTVQNNSTFSGNPRSGLYISFAGAINITGGTIENNGTGLYVYCSQSLNFNQPLTSFANNGVDIIVDPTCPISITYAPAPLPLIIVAQKGQGEFELNCIGQDGFAVNLPNGDLVNIFCPVSGRAVINRVDNSTLPADLPAGYTYASAFALDILQQGAPIPVITEGGYIQASFVGQSLQPGNTYSILYWDDWKFENGNWVEHPESGSWVPLKDFLVGKNGLLKNFDLYPGAATDTRKIISGVKLVTKNGVQRVEVSANFPGTFALAQH